MPNRYTSIVDRARRQTVFTLARVARLRLARIYVEEIDRVIIRLGRGEITMQAAEDFIADLERALRRVGVRSEAEVKRLALDAIKNARAAHIQATAAEGASTSFAGVSAEAYESLFIRRELSVVESFKTLRRHSMQADAKRLAQALEAAALRGHSPQKLVEQVASSLANGDPFVRAAVDKYGSGRGMKKFAGRGPDPEAFKVAKSLAADAWRIARTEMAMGFHEGDRTSAVASPVVGALKWNLSPRHRVPDVCDLLAKVDVHGLGPGIYPPELVPVKPHPHDLCFNTYVLRPEPEWTSGKQLPKRGRRVTLKETLSLLASETPKASRRAYEQINELTSRAWAVYEKS